MDQVFVGNRIMREVDFLHRASRTLIAVDLVENFSDETAGTNVHAAGNDNNAWNVGPPASGSRAALVHARS
jgi:hypothetical protein